MWLIIDHKTKVSVVKGNGVWKVMVIVLVGRDQVINLVKYGIVVKIHSGVVIPCCI